MNENIEREKCVEDLIEILKLFQVSYDNDEIIRYFKDEDDIVKALAQFLAKADYRRVPAGAVILTKEEWQALMGATYTTKEVDEINAYHERRARREERNKFLEFLDSRYVKEDGRHEWRDRNNDCIDRCKKAFVEQFCIKTE